MEKFEEEIISVRDDDEKFVRKNTRHFDIYSPHGKSKIRIKSLNPNVRIKSDF
jgi:hypothetical protein